MPFLRLTTDRLSPETSSLGEEFSPSKHLRKLFLKLILLLAQALMLISKEKLDLYRLYSGDPWLRVPLGNRRKRGKRKTLI